MKSNHPHFTPPAESIERRIPDILSRLTLEEKIDLLGGEPDGRYAGYSAWARGLKKSDPADGGRKPEDCGDKASVPRPVKELKGFASVALAPGERRTIELEVTERDLQFFCPRRRSWVAEPGAFTVSIGASAADVRLTGTFMYVRDHRRSVAF